MNIQISAIICTLNRSAYLKKAIQSLIDQTLPKEQYEIIVVDNGSTDNTKTIVEGFKYFKNLHYIYEPIIGLSQARNTGWQNAQGKYVTYLDDDAIACPEWLARIVKAFGTVRPRPGSVGGKIEPIWEVERPAWLSKQLELRLTIVDWADKATFLTEDHQHLRGCNVAYSREILQKFGGFSTILGRKGTNLLSNEEDLLERHLKKQNFGIYYDPEIRVHHHILSERLVKRWFYRRYFWQGVSDVILEYIETSYSGNNWRYLYRVVRNVLSLFRHPTTLLSILIPANSASWVVRKCNLYARLGLIWTQLRIALPGRRKEKEYIKYSNKKILEITPHSLRDQKEDRRSQRPNKGGKLNILFLSPYLPVQGIHGGGGRMFSLIRELSRRHNIYVISSVTRKESTYVAVLKRYCHEVKAVLKSYPGLDVSSLIPSQVRAYHSPAMHQEIKDFLKTHKIDIISAEYILMSDYLVENYRSTLTLHQLNFLSYYRDWKRKNPFCKVFTFLPILRMLNYEIKVSQRYHRVIVLTEYEKRILNLFVPRLKVEVIPTGADKEYFSPRRVKESNDLIYIGYFLHSPNVDAMLYFRKSIYPLIKKELPKTRLQIIGYQPPPKIQALAQDKSITVTGHIKDLRPYLAKSKVFINPVRLGAGIRGKVLEAWAMAKPVVSTSIGCQGLEAITGRHLFIADRPEVFASQTVKLLKDKKLRLKMGMAGRRLVESKYNWEVIARKLEGIYQELVLEE